MTTILAIIAIAFGCYLLFGLSLWGLMRLNPESEICYDDGEVMSFWKGAYTIVLRWPSFTFEARP